MHASNVCNAFHSIKAVKSFPAFYAKLEHHIKVYFVTYVTHYSDVNVWMT